MSLLKKEDNPFALNFTSESQIKDIHIIFHDDFIKYTF